MTGEEQSLLSKSNRIGSLLVLVSLAAALTVVASVGQANAYCKGEGLSYNWSVGWADERSKWSSTCDAEGDCYGQFLDGVTDGRDEPLELRGVHV